MGFAPLPGEGRSTWNDKEAQDAFRVISRLIVAGDPVRSRFLLKPLHPDGGGSYAHNGVRRWQTRGIEFASSTKPSAVNELVRS